MSRPPPFGLGPAAHVHHRKALQRRPALAIEPPTRTGCLPRKVPTVVGSSQRQGRLRSSHGTILNLDSRQDTTRPRVSDLSVLQLGAAMVLDAAGLTSLALRIEGSVQAVDRLNLDGLLAPWHPPVGN